MSRTANADVLKKLNVTLPDDKDHFCCALICEVMDDPVIDPYTLNPAALLWFRSSMEEKAILDCGNFKEVPRHDRKTLEKLISPDGTGKSPNTRLLFTAQELISDVELKHQIDLFIHPLREQASRLDAEAEAEAAFSRLKMQFTRGIRFLSLPARGTATAGQRIPSDEVNPILQQVVYGNENAAKAALEAIKNDPTQLSVLLSDTGTVKDYSDRTITDMTLLQAAAASGDIDMCLMLKNYLSPEEFATQLAEIFPEGIEAHEGEQQCNTFNFDAILAAIRAANTSDLDAALNKTNNDSALCRALKEFRRQFSELSNNEKIFNPQHLLRAFGVYSVLWNQCGERDGSGSDPDYKKSDLFWRQIIGYTQRFMPACYAQAFAQGLYYLVKVDRYEFWRPEPFNRALKLKHNNFSYFPLPDAPRSGLGFDFAIYVTDSRAAGSPELRRARRGYSIAYCRSPMAFFKNFCRAKTASFQNITPRVRVQSHAQSEDRRCVVR